MGMVIYFSSKSENTHRFVAKLGLPSKRIPISSVDHMPEANEPFVLVVPTYADDAGKGAVPKQVIHFLNNEKNRSYLKGVIAGGNRNFGRFYGYAGDVIAARCQVPCLYRFELMGTEDDVARVKTGMEKLWK